MNVRGNAGGDSTGDIGAGQEKAIFVGRNVPTWTGQKA